MDKFEVLKKYFGYMSFREGQEELIDGILEGRDALGIMPTGAGKSICYQVPSLLLPGITLVISPLISLMMDQVKALNQAGIHAAYINSSLTENQIQKALQYAGEGRYKIIYVAPERLETESFLYFAAHTEISMVTVDEAHCISQWGQDFRPSYLKIVRFIESFTVRPIVSAFTATATRVVKDDIICVLGLNHPKTLVTGFDRENLYFEVRQPAKKDRELYEYMSRHEGESGIIYCATRKNVEAVCALLEDHGVPATKYHAGLGNEVRKQNQEDFIYDRKPVMVATNAFGMGIDKSNVRYVIHYNMPQSLENYYQEAGRAGRDGQASECLILYSPQDVMISQFLIENKGDNQDYTWEEMASLRENDEARLRSMTFYCTTRNCLREYILNYFGEYGGDREPRSHNCGNCSNCLTEYEEVDMTELAGDVIHCVKECGQRYGINVITGVLRGENKAKLRSYGLTGLRTFGLRQEMSEGKLKEVINEMIIEKCLFITKDKFMLVKLASGAREITEEGRRLMVKCLPEKAEREREAARRLSESRAGSEGKKKSAGKRISDVLNSRGMELFDRLREKRLEIAREEAVPPYIVFSDKTLLDMCIKVPLNHYQMLSVTGVGENKFDRYGERFISCIFEFCGGEPGKYYFEEEDGSVPSVEASSEGKRSKRGAESGSVPGPDGNGCEASVLVLKGAGSKEPEGRKTRAEKPKGKQEFVMTAEIAEQLYFGEECTLSDLVGQMNDLREESSMKRLTNKAVMEKLAEEGYLNEVRQNGIWNKTVFDKGQQTGITLENRISAKGTRYQVFRFSQEAQKVIVDKLLGDWRDLMAGDS